LAISGIECCLKNRPLINVFSVQIPVQELCTDVEEKPKSLLTINCFDCKAKIETTMEAYKKVVAQHKKPGRLIRYALKLYIYYVGSNPHQGILI
jgi:hypothetical protein